ncbi:hypothetical protein [Phycicoccus avicenniae]|uniref:hypothetical protein n=1 Tax=Phycicoccus avicenniae TaxID=2828860 RepID=UPI003D2B56BE
MLPVPDLDARRPGRRLLLAGAGAALLAPLSGCGIRLEDDAPRVPLVPTRSPLAAEQRLVALTSDCERLAGLADALGTTLGTGLATLHRRQHTVLRTALLRRQVPAAGLDAVTSPSASSSSSSTSPSPTASPRPGPALGAEEAAAAREVGAFAEAEASLLPTLAALHAQRWAAATVLTGAAPAPAAAVPPVVLDAVGSSVVEAADTAAYLAEVGAARSSGARRERGEGTVRVLRALRTELRSGEDPPPVGLGHPLPFAVRTGADVDRMLTTTLTSLRATLGTALPDLVAADPGAGLPAATRWLGTVEVEAHRWGVPLVPFPGLA